MSKSKNDDAWEKIFDKYKIINILEKSDSFLISSNDINNFRQARLMTKFDHRSQLPTLFADNNLSILPVSRGSYIIGEFEIPFPQADSFERVINLCELLNQKDSLTKEEITQNYDFEARQTNYYGNAGKYLRLLERRQINDSTSWFLTDKGRSILNLSIVDRQIKFTKLILSHAVFNDVLKVYFKTGQIPTKQEIVPIMRSHDLWNISAETTYERRSSTIISWINWIISLVEE